MGMDMANCIAVLRGLLPEAHYRRMHPVLYKNYAGFSATPICAERMLSALMKDKKNTTSKLVLVLPIGEEAKVQRVEVAPDGVFFSQCKQSLQEICA